MNELLKQIKKNDEKFMSYFNCEETVQNNKNIDALSYVAKSRIKELEVLVEMLEEMKLEQNSTFDLRSNCDLNYYNGHNQVLDRIIQILKDTIKKLKNKN